MWSRRRRKREEDIEEARFLWGSPRIRDRSERARSQGRSAGRRSPRGNRGSQLESLHVVLLAPHRAIVLGVKAGRPGHRGPRGPALMPRTIATITPPGRTPTKHMPSSCPRALELAHLRAFETSPSTSGVCPPPLSPTDDNQQRTFHPSPKNKHARGRAPRVSTVHFDASTTEREREPAPVPLPPLPSPSPTPPRTPTAHSPGSSAAIPPLHIPARA